MSLFILPSLTALGIKLWIFLVSRGELFRNSPLLAFFLCALFALNLAELLILLNVSEASQALPLMMAYYVAAIYSATALLMLVTSLIWQKRFLNTGIMIVATTVAILTCIPGIFLSGAASIGYSLIRVPGEFYWAQQSFLLAILFFAVCTMFYGALKSKSSLVRKRSFALILSTAPLALTAMIIILIMSTGYLLNATVILSLVTTITLVILIYTESRYRLFLFLSYVPYTRESEIRKAVADLVRESVEALFRSGGMLDMKAISGKFETTLIELAIEATDGNKTHAAEILQIGKATLHRKLGKA